jgi:2-polyprenyl-3-methyl-5-hydroxy-6-metoxy-1,4-benzoquinol methylase
MDARKCRSCHAPLSVTFADLGMSPLSNSFVPPDRALGAETFLPLHAYVCGNCWLVQVLDFESPANIFKNYVYLSAYSDTWLRHCQRYCEQMVARFGLGERSLVVEIASNDGTLLKTFMSRAIPVLGVEPAENVAEIAKKAGVPTEAMFFGAKTAKRLKESGYSADLMAANNVLAHVPDINDFVIGFAVLLAPEGVVTFEFPSLKEQIAGRQFDTIYHEHFSYLSLHVVQAILARHGLRIFDVESLTTHGGSLRVFACHENASHTTDKSVEAQIRTEQDFGLLSLDTYRSFADRVIESKLDTLEFLVKAKRDGKTVVGYGAPAKASTMLNYCGIGPELIRFTVDRNPAKHGMLMPGCRVPILPPQAIFGAKPDYVVILPWNLRDEITSTMASISEWGGRFVVLTPGVRVI